MKESTHKNSSDYDASFHSHERVKKNDPVTAIHDGEHASIEKLDDEHASKEVPSNATKTKKADNPSDVAKYLTVKRSTAGELI